MDDSLRPVMEVDIACVGFGPGAEELAHTTRECVPVTDLIVARHAYCELVRAYLEP